MHELKAFLVEDSPIISANLIATLEELLPLKVLGVAQDEGSAVEWLIHNDPPVDLVIVDLFLKSGSGLGVLQVANALPQHGHLVVLSNYVTPDIRRKCLQIGAHRVFDKSHEIDDLIQYCAGLAAGDAASGVPVASDGSGLN
jgi:DNA-binding NarL/FixJ family response regulator